MPGTLEAKLTVTPKRTSDREEFLAVVSLINAGAEPLVVNLAPLASPSLALEIIDYNGVPVGLPPPPVPGMLPRLIHMTPGEVHTLEFSGFVPQWLPSGSYRVRLSYTYQPVTSEPIEWTGVLFSNWCEFVIANG